MQPALLVKQSPQAEFELCEQSDKDGLTSHNSLTDFGFLLQVERVDFVDLSIQTEEEGSLIRLQGSLRVLQYLAVGCFVVCCKDWSSAQLLDELGK